MRKNTKEKQEGMYQALVDAITIPDHNAKPSSQKNFERNLARLKSFFDRITSER